VNTDAASLVIRDGEAEDAAKVFKRVFSGRSAYWAEWSAKHYRTSVAYLDGKPIGAVTYTVVRLGRIDAMYIVYIGVVPEARRRGVARALISHVERAWAGCIVATMRRDNRASRGLFASLGYAVTDLYDEALNKLFGACCDEVVSTLYAWEDDCIAVKRCGNAELRGC